ncbi:MAG TPA: SDR family NAD(P)-dependent oxidoreductase [Vicinamibacterales bacterium]|nr:SDR family NAD(P)-dependent oxidoreductase [Vicinamibacterales bacterium]
MIVLVTGASRGIGRGVAQALADAGATVYATGRSIAGATLPAAATRIACDHTDDGQVAAVFDRIREERGTLDVLVNGVWGGYERMMENGQFTWPNPFWQQPAWRWDAMMNAGVRAGYVASQHAAQLMVPAARGLIVHLSHWAAHKHQSNVAYGVSKAATDKMAAHMAHELQPHGVTSVSLYPGLVRTEAVMQFAQYLDLSNSESPEFTGRVVAALAADPAVSRFSGRWLVVAALAAEYGITDIDGKQPRPLTLADV